MSLRTIPEIKVGSFAPGTCLNAYIYNANVTVGVGGEPTKVTLNLVNESGLYNVDKSILSATVPYTIQIGSLKFKSMYLTSYEFKQSVGEKTVDLTFTDASIILDKIYVLLLNKEASPWNMGSYRGTWNFGNNRIQRQYRFPLVCSSSCERTNFPPFNSKGLAYNPWQVTDPPENKFLLYPNEPYGNNRSGLEAIWTHYADKAMVTNANLINGGSIIIGEEQFVSNECALPDVSYTFNELLAVMSMIGITVDGLHDRGKPDLRQRYTGSLRSVLNSWAGLYGFSVVWDFGTNKIKAIDLFTPQTNMDAIHSAISNIKDDGNGVAITDIQRSATLEGTYNQDSVSVFLKPSKVRNNDRKFNGRTAWRPLTINNFIPFVENSAQWYYTTGGRNKQELIISSILAKYNPAARTLYNYYLMATKTNDFTNGSDVYGKVLGLNIKGKLNDEQKGDLLSYCMSMNNRVANQEKYGKGGAVYIGTYSKDLEDSWIEWERKIAESIGKYYYLMKPMKDSFFCTGYEHFVQEVTCKPNSEAYNYNNQHNLPFKDLLRHPGGKVLPLVDPIAGNMLSNYSHFWVYSRNNSYGFKPEDLDGLFYNKDGEEVLKEHLPSHQVIEGQESLFLDDMLKNLFPAEVYNALSEIKLESKKPSLFFFPTRAVVQQRFDAGNLMGFGGFDWAMSFPDAQRRTAAIFMQAPGTVFNKYEWVQKNDNAEEKDCELMCDEDILQKMCACPEGDFYQAENVGLSAPFARWFIVTIPGSKLGSAVLILPSEYPYMGYISVETKTRRVVNSIKQQFGGLTNARSAMEYRVNVADITSDIDSMDDQSKIGGPVAPGGENGQIISHVAVPGFTALQTASNFHQLTNPTHSSLDPKESLSFTMAGLNFSPISSFMHVEKGLNSLSISLTDNGVQVSVGFSSKEYPNISDELRLQRIGPKLNPNSFMRTW